jgi:hypothetical protein
MCNVVYKIAFKMLANRLKKILPELVYEEQSAFVHGRLTNNVITAYVCLHFMKSEKSKNNSHCALKPDMQKAYESIERIYLEERSYFSLYLCSSRRRFTLLAEASYAFRGDEGHLGCPNGAKG